MTWRDFLKPAEVEQLAAIDAAKRGGQRAYKQIADRCRKRAERSRK